MSETNDTQATPKAAKTTAAAPAMASPPSTASPILKQGTPPENAFVPTSPDPALAGVYELVHGSVTFGAGQVAYPGAVLQLSAEDARTMLNAGVVKAFRS